MVTALCAQRAVRIEWGATSSHRWSCFHSVPPSPRPGIAQQRHKGMETVRAWTLPSGEQPSRLRCRESARTGDGNVGGLRGHRGVVLPVRQEDLNLLLSLVRLRSHLRQRAPVQPATTPSPSACFGFSAYSKEESSALCLRLSMQGQWLGAVGLASASQPHQTSSFRAAPRE